MVSSARAGEPDVVRSEPDIPRPRKARTAGPFTGEDSSDEKEIFAHVVRAVLRLMAPTTPALLNIPSDILVSLLG